MVERIESIVIGKRVRKDLGDLESLKSSLAEFGLMNPIVINNHKELIAGHRRLEAAKVLGWETIKVLVVEESNKLRLLEWELEENLQRKDFTEAELQEAQKRLEQLRKKPFFPSLWSKIKAFFKKLFPGKT